MALVTAFGEVLLRLAAPRPFRLAQAAQFDGSYSGTEANVLAALGQWGHATRFVTRLPDHPLGDAALLRLRSAAIETTHIARGGPRMALYFVEPAAGERSGQVIYDRADSSLATWHAHDIPWPAVFQDAHWFHLTGVTAALSESARHMLHAALRAARDAGLTVSCDLNFRSKLWTSDAARPVMVPLLNHIDLLIANEDHAREVFAPTYPWTPHFGPDADLNRTVDLAHHLIASHALPAVALTVRRTLSPQLTAFGAVLCAPSSSHIEPLHQFPVVDRIGSGDAFAAGLIHGTAHRWDPTRALAFAVAAARLKHAIPDDWLLASESEILDLATRPRTGDIRR